MMRGAVVALIALLGCSVARAQDYGVHRIPEELTRSANAVVRLDETSFTYTGKTSGTSRHTLVVTVFDDSGDNAAVFYEYATGARSLKSFSGEIFDRAGKPIRKIKRSDLKQSEFSEGLADDTRSYIYEPYVPSYPFTVKYDYEMQFSGGIIFFPVFSPLPGAGVALERASYKLTLPAGTRFHWHSPNMPIEPEHRENGKTEEWVWKLENLRPLASEAYAPRLRDRVPVVYLTPHEFTYGGLDGVMDTWDNYARWQWRLLEGRGKLPEPLKAQVAEITRDAATDLEKIQAVYDYLAATTRYVSVQIGIGGLQPMTAAEVYKNKFGDCKALSNYMQAMLAECGIESHYVEIGMDTRNIIPEYVSPLLSNHAILQVPLGDGVMWLECTAPEIPLGYVHPGIAGQNALVYKNGTAEIVEVPVCADSLNVSEIRGELTLSADGSMKGHAVRTDRNDRYMESSRMVKMDGRERTNRLQGSINIPLAHVSNIRFTEYKSAQPYSVTEYDIETRQAAETSGGRIFLDVSPLRKYPGEKLGRSARKTDIVVSAGFCDREQIEFGIPDGMALEALPPPVAIDTKYGQFMQAVLPADGKIVISRSFLLRRGTYPAGEFAAFKEFMDSVENAYGSKIVLKRE